ncbi:hypothetical protein [uncultured Sphingomonas sp.]|uniref:hypothetical protein n=1 Tax=uncultured Sphingomonas sp. TaxID=158754 RepID=UPI00261C8891|nr:hypothetical protein [uncultured Sphingomonas sp.]
MNNDIESIMSGEPFRTGGGIAHVIGRHRATGDADGEVLLLQVVRFTGSPYRAFTTVPALALNLETGGWTMLHDDRLAA